MQLLKSGFFKGAEFLVAGMLATMFFTFIIQIIFRYFFTPIGWTVELITVLWIWIVFVGNAFVVRGKDHVTFDILYLVAPNKVQRVMAGISALVVGAVFLWSWLPTWDYFQFLQIKKTPLLKIPYNVLFSCFIIFITATVIACIGKIVASINDTLPESPNEVLLDVKSRSQK